MFVSVKRFGFKEWINVFEQKCPKSENYSLALKLHSANGSVRNGIVGFPAHCALALRAPTYPEKQRQFLTNKNDKNDSFLLSR